MLDFPPRYPLSWCVPDPELFRPLSPAPFACPLTLHPPGQGDEQHPRDSRAQKAGRREREAPAAACPPSTLFGRCVGLGPSAGPCLCLLWGRPLTALFPDVKSSSLTPFIGAIIPLSTDVNQKEMKTTHMLNWINSNFYKPLQA